MATVQSDKFTVTFVFVAALLILFVQSVTSQSATSHSETYTYTVTSMVRICSTSYRKCCSGSWWWRSCHTCSSQNCYDGYEIQTRQDTRCQAGWQLGAGGLCNVAICTPGCLANQVCTAPGSCQCLTAGGGQCSIVACSSINNCYPGSCSNGACLCPPGMSGPNCLTISVTPTITSCWSKLYAGTSQVAMAPCTTPTVQAPRYWVATTGINKIEVNWQVASGNLPGLPVGIPFVQDAKLGVASSQFTININQNAPMPNQGICPGLSSSSPKDSQNCDINMNWADLNTVINERDNITVTVIGQNGGYKTGNVNDPNGNFDQQFFLGIPANVRMTYTIDTISPTHCLLTNPPSRCLNSSFPIYIDADVRTNPVISPLFYEWTDTGSGVLIFRVAIFYLQPGIDNTLQETGSYLIQQDVGPDRNDFKYTFPASGVFSIHLIVLDGAGNMARARKIVNYDGDSKLVVNSDAPFFIAEASPETGYQWITTLPPVASGTPYSLTVIWKGRFQPDPRYANWLLRVQPFMIDPSTPCTALNNCVDDIYGSTYGQRSVDAITTITGITGFGVAYTSDSNGGQGVSPDNYTMLLPTVEQTTISFSQLFDGDTIVVWLKVINLAGAEQVIQLLVGVDRVRPDIIGEPTFLPANVDAYTSTVSINVVDRQSGIQSISFGIYDKTLQIFFKNSSVPASTMARYVADTTRSKRQVEASCTNSPTDTSCYCIPMGTCYPSVQLIQIDHCWFDRYSKDPLVIYYTVTNQAKLQISGTVDITGAANLPCRPNGLSAGAIAGVVIGVCVPTIVCVVLGVLMCWRWRTHKDPLPSRVRTMYNRTFRHKMDNNELYGSNSTQSPLPPPYTIRNDGSSGSSATKAGKNVEVGKIINAKGRFSDVRSGWLIENNLRVAVAVKSLKDGFSEEDHVLMSKKIAFMANVKVHPNIVKFEGVFSDDSPTGPAMLLELCSVTLTDWLRDLKVVAVDELESMLSFALQIACGVRHLHSNKIIHRRLGIRNVLLKEEHGSLVAKITGFGPLAEDVNGPNLQDTNTLPIRYMAPEMFDNNCKYTEQADIWAYGITVWEIYAKGHKPYPEVSTNDVQKFLKQGNTMPCPQYCNPEIYEKVIKVCWKTSPSKRPKLAAICKIIEDLRRGSPDDIYYGPNMGAVPTDDVYDDVA